MSRKEHLGKYDSNVGYALYVIDNIKKDDYARLNTGQIVKVKGIKENECNKKAIYYYPGVYNDDWFDSSAVENFSPNIIDLIEVGDYVNGWKVRGKTSEKVVVDYYMYSEQLGEGQWLTFYKDNIKSIVTHESFNSIKYEVI